MVTVRVQSVSACESFLRFIRVLDRRVTVMNSNKSKDIAIYICDDSNITLSQFTLKPFYQRTIKLNGISKMTVYVLDPHSRGSVLCAIGGILSYTTDLIIVE